jgi:hypothetical protein
MIKMYEGLVLSQLFYRVADIQNAAAQYESPFEASRMSKSSMGMIGWNFAEVDHLIRKGWVPSLEINS